MKSFIFLNGEKFISVCAGIKRESVMEKMFELMKSNPNIIIQTWEDDELISTEEYVKNNFTFAAVAYGKSNDDTLEEIADADENVYVGNNYFIAKDRVLATTELLRNRFPVIERYIECWYNGDLRFDMVITEKPL